MSFMETYAPEQQGMGMMPRQHVVYDGKRMRKLPVSRKMIDYSSTMITMLHNRHFSRSAHPEIGFLPPAPQFNLKLAPPSAMQSEPSSGVTTHYQHASTNVVTWTPEGRRLITGTSKGEFTLWNGMAFNFETIQQSHSHPVRAMIWSHDDAFLVSADQNGWVKYWQSNMNNLKEFQAHQDVIIRDLAFCPSDLKFASCSDDGTIKIWNFETCKEDREFKHGSDVRCCDWHPLTSLIASGTKDNQMKLWDAKSASEVATINMHHNTIFRAKWNKNGNWLITGGRDKLIKLFDIRFMKEMQTFKGHERDITSMAWHPFMESLFVSGDQDGAMFFWSVGCNQPQGKIAKAHDAVVWDLKWHPLGHILCSGSGDNTTKFWVRNRLGDEMRDKWNAGQLPNNMLPEQAAPTPIMPNAPQASSSQQNMGYHPTAMPSFSAMPPMPVPMPGNQPRKQGYSGYFPN